MTTPLQFYLITDSHYVSKRNWVEAEPFTGREKGDQIALKLSPEILDGFLDKIKADEQTNIVLFTGDNVNNGDKNSHEEFIARLRDLQAAGKRVFVTNATHDYCGDGEDENFFHAVRYTETGTEDIESVHQGDLFDMYYDFGPAEADSVHKESGSYTVLLSPGCRLVMINDNGNGRSHCGLFQDGMQWLTEVLKKAKADGEIVFAAVHHPVLPPWEVYRHLVEFEMVGGYALLKTLFCEENVHVVFTGHTHVQNIQKYTDEQGRWFYDVSTIALVSAYGKMRKVSVDVEARRCKITSVQLEKLEGAPQDKPPQEYLYRINFTGLLESLMPLIKTDFNRFLSEASCVLPTDKLKKHRILAKAALKKLDALPLSVLAKFGKKYNGLTKTEIAALKSKRALTPLFEVMRCVFPGNAPFTPDTVEYKVFTGVTKKADALLKRFPVEKVTKLIPPGSSLTEMAIPMLYNNRTGDDDNLETEV